MSERYSKHFTVAELQCPTSKQIILEDDFGEHLEDLRVDYDYIMNVTSGCRSKDHNKKVDGHPRSLHMIGNPYWNIDTCAIDIKRPSGDKLHRLIRIASDKQWSIGIAETFIHLDLRSFYINLPPRIYTY